MSMTVMWKKQLLGVMKSFIYANKVTVTRNLYTPLAKDQMKL